MMGWEIIMPIVASDLRRALENKRLLKTKERTLKGVKPPKSDEVDYRIALLKMLRESHAQITATIEPMLVWLEPQYVKDSTQFQDTPRQDVLGALDNLSKSLELSVSGFATRAATLFAEKITRKNSDRLKKSFEKSFGISLPALVKEENIKKPISESIDENTALIKTIPQDHINWLKKNLSQGIVQGKSAVDLRNVMRDGLNISERRVRVIARDQTSKLNGVLTKTRAQNAGSERYRWIGRDDDLERNSHRKLNNKIFYWNDPPVMNLRGERGHPGDDIQCRCYAEIILDL